MNKYQDNWLQYRVMAEALQKEKYLFLTESKPYNNPDAFNELVLRVEALLAEENSQWVDAMRQQQQDEKKDQDDEDKKK